ncbi:MAG: TIGR04282 family arsenosugar biosynthesis glycosyltransferase [Ferruginibacter sp.]|nr:TIGR04282 family arsenosugar biosynthesis glycosyltransferase [Ferruginibacter sp.]
MSSSEKALIIFARKPIVGKVKTRLAKSIGEDKALQVYIKLLEHTRAVANHLTWNKLVFLTEPIGDDFWNGFICEQQQGNLLGEKMKFAFEELFNKGYKQCVIIGSDCPGLTKEIVEEAFLDLLENDVAIGPAVDGGYYLLGMNKIILPLFNNKDWGTDSVFKQTITDIENLQLTYKILSVLNDVDEEKDVPDGWLAALE